MSKAHPQYPWRRSMFEAIVETDPERQLAKIIYAERAVSVRLNQGSADQDEQLAIQYALCALNVLQRTSSIPPSSGSLC